MKVVAVHVLEYELACRGGSYALSKGRAQTHRPAVVVWIYNDDEKIKKNVQKIGA